MSGMTSERLDVLRRIAKMATPGPWGRDGRIVYALTHYGYRNGIEQREQRANKVTISVQKGRDCSAEEADAVALHIATFDPPTVLALLDEIERLRREQETLADLLRQVDVVMDGAAMDGVKSILAPQYQDDWALVHTMVREQIALIDDEEGSEGA